jgi:intergrase/recombinase
MIAAFAKQSVNWNDFREWCLSKFSIKYAKTITSYAIHYHNLLNQDFSMLHSLSRDKRMHVLKALSNLSKFLGCHRHYKQLLEECGVKWERPRSIDVFKNLYSENGNSNSLDWIIEAIKKLPYRYSFTLAFMTLTGLRPIEAICSLTIIAKQGLSGYYNTELHTLEHFKYTELFLRRTKNAFISAIPELLEKELEKWNCKVSYNGLRMALIHRGICCRISELRKFFATYLREKSTGVEIIDTLQGRVGNSIFYKHYWRPDIKQLLRRTNELLDPLAERLLRGINDNRNTVLT